MTLATLLKDNRSWIGIAVLVSVIAGLAVSWSPIMGLAAPVGAILFAAVVARPTLALPLMYFMLLTSDVIPTGINIVVPITLSKIAMMGITLAWLVRCMVTQRWPLTFHIMTVPMVATVITLAVGLIHAREIDNVSIALVVGFGMVLVMIDIIVAMVELKDLKLALLGIAVVHVLVVGLAIPLGVYPEENGVEIGSRNAGFAGDANYWALLVLIGLAPTVAILDSQKQVIFRLLAVVGVAFAGVSVVLTVSRSGMLLTATMLPLLTAILWRRKWLLLVSLIVAVIAVQLLVDFGPAFDRFNALYDEGEFETDGSLQSRSALLWYAIELFWENPIFGVGTGSIRADLAVLTAGHLDKVPHNTYLNILAEQGIVGSLPFLAIILTSLYAVVKMWIQQKTRAFRTITLGFGASIVAYMVMALTLDMVVAAPVYFLLAIIIVLYRMSSHSPLELAEAGLAEDDDPVVIQARKALESEPA